MPLSCARAARRTPREGGSASMANAAAVPDAPLRVFLSSTSVDLERDRARVADLVGHLGHFAVVMDRFALRPDLDATEVALDELRGCQLYIVLVAWRYGTVPAGQELSVTHQEYREARRLDRERRQAGQRGMPCFVFLADPSTERDYARFPLEGRDVDHREQLETFRAELAGSQ